jgi:phage anti-repressor protein
MSDQQQYQKTFSEKQKAKGLVLISDWIPLEDKNRIKKYLTSKRKAYLASK